MITRMSLTNFKSWPKVELELGQISVLFGANSSGKTSLLQALLALKQTAASFDRRRAFDFGEEGKEQDLVVLGSFRDVVHAHDVNRTISIKLDWRPSSPVKLGTNIDTQTLDYEVVWKSVHDDVIVNQLRYGADGIRFDMGRTHDTLPLYEWRLYNDRAQSDIPFQSQSSLPPDFCYGIPREYEREDIKEHMGIEVDLLEFNRQFELLMDHIAYLGPLREYPHRRYTWTGATPKAIDPRGRGTLDALLAAERQKTNGAGIAADHSSTLVEKVAEWLKRFQLSEKFYLAPIDRDQRIYEARLQTRGTEAIIADVGFGASQVLPVIVLLHFVPEGSIVLLEQPEIHLHPSVQAEMADLFLETAYERNLQLVIESHSEHLLRRLQRRIAEAEQPLASPASIHLYFCELSPQGSTRRRVEADEFGSILNWPDRFFGDEVGDLDAMTTAALRRKKGMAARG